VSGLPTPRVPAGRSGGSRHVARVPG